jgi:hypothetical protein
MPANYVLLEKIVVGAGGASSVGFSSIPQTGYTDLVIKVSARSLWTGGTTDSLGLYLNGVQTNRTRIALNGNGSSAGSSTSTYRDVSPTPASLATASTFSNVEIYIPNYASANYKSFSSDSVMENNATASDVAMYAGLWSTTAAITSISFDCSTSGLNFDQYSTFYLYGVAKLGTSPAIAPKATGGDVIMTDGTYWYHAFRSSGTFTPTSSISCDVVTVAGGGGGSGAASYAGGGAGGLIASTSQSFSPTAYTVTIGAGGAGSGNGANTASSGTNSTFQTLTAAVGGGGAGGGWTGTGNGPDGVAGGSGGGGGGSYTVGGATTQRTGGAPTSGQGFAGGSGSPNTATAANLAGGGGGGAGAVGTAGSSGGVGGSGGAGLSTYSTWATATNTGVSGFYAGGGAAFGQSGNGTAGSGNGGSVNNAPTANTGGGGNGSASTGTAGASGIVIVRYAV